jgi:phosphotriesterase-related protein
MADTTLSRKKAMTVDGLVSADELGHILPHEHILCEIPNAGFRPLYPDLLDRKVTLDMLGRLRRDIWSCRENYRLDEPEVALQEVASFKRRGGGTIVDVTTVGLKRNVPAAAEIARRAGIHLVVGTGLYVHFGHPADVATRSQADLAAWMISEVREGIEGTGVRAGIIGEIGIASPMHPDEEKVLRAALHAQRETGAPLSIHQVGGAELEQIDTLVQEMGVSPQSVVLSHMGSVSSEQRLRAAGRGYSIEIDCFGNEYYEDALSGRILQDPGRIKMVQELIEHGHLQQVLVSNDVALKMLQKKYGGWSYEHILANIKPFMLRMGIPPKSIDSMLYYNPARMIAYLD